MKVKPSQPGKVVVEVGSREPALLGGELPINIRRILVPVDFSTLSNKALEYALAFGRQFQAQIFIIHVVEIPFGTGEAAVIASVIDDVHRESEQKLSRLIAETKRTGLAVQSLLERGTAYYEIAKAAREHEIDLIIIATHGHTGLRHVFMGSTAERVVRHAPCPVLVVREKEHEFIRETRITRREPQPAKEAAMSR